MCTNYTPTKKADWVKKSFGVDLPIDYPDEAYPGFLEVWGNTSIR
jgi:hypothetical protein